MQINVDEFYEKLAKKIIKKLKKIGFSQFAFKITNYKKSEYNTNFNKKNKNLIGICKCINNEIEYNFSVIMLMQK